jgi:hypothetical protein
MLEYFSFNSWDRVTLPDIPETIGLVVPVPGDGDDDDDDQGEK